MTTARVVMWFFVFYPQEQPEQLAVEPVQSYIFSLSRTTP